MAQRRTVAKRKIRAAISPSRKILYLVFNADQGLHELAIQIGTFTRALMHWYREKFEDQYWDIFFYTTRDEETEFMKNDPSLGAYVEVRDAHELGRALKW
jgi:hypothetical protein